MKTNHGIKTQAKVFTYMNKNQKTLYNIGL